MSEESCLRILIILPLEDASQKDRLDLHSRTISDPNILQQ